MQNYHAVLSRAVRSLGACDLAARRHLYDEARVLLEERLRSEAASAGAGEINAHRIALADAIERIEYEIAGHGAVDGAVETTAIGAADEGPVAPAWRRALLIGLAVITAAAVAVAYVLWMTASRPSLSDRKAVDMAASQSEDLAPGVDGGSSDQGLPYYLRRQTVFYRSTHPPGTLIVHKFQHYLYLVTGDTIAWRYGMGLGESCIDLAGLRKVSQKSEWPSWRPDQTAEARLAAAGQLPGGPGNPLGARMLDLDDGQSRIHGTNAPGTIGRTLARGCIRLVNEDVVDLYERIPVGTRVVITN